MTLNHQETAINTSIAEYVNGLNVSNTKGNILRKCFSAVVDRKDLEVSFATAINIIVIELQVDKSLLTEQLVLILSKALVYYMSIWPGWARSTEYFRGVLTFKDWFDKFKEYLSYKMHYILQNKTKWENNATNACNNIQKENVEKSVQTDSFNGVNKKESGFILHVQMPYENLKCSVDGFNLQLESFKNEPKGGSLNWTQLLNWPHLEVEVKLPDIHVSRKNVHETKMHIIINDDPIATTDTEKKIFPEVLIINKKLEEYKGQKATQLSSFITKLLSRVNIVKDINKKRIEELSEVFNQLMQDIDEVHNFKDASFSTNIYVTYHIRAKRFYRIKKNPNEAERNAKIGISELFTPKVKYGIHNVKLKANGHELFRNYQEDDIRFIVNNASLTLRCNLCDLMFSGPYATVGAEFHFSTEHPHDEKLFCSTCLNEIDFKYICGLRWCHVCIPTVD